MTATSRAEGFAAALRHFEETGDDGELRGQFADDAELLRPEVVTSEGGRPDVARFWDEYRLQFSRVGTEFVRLDEAGDLAVLEWVSRGELATGRPIEYRGASLLTFDDRDRIRRFATYFDTAAFLQPETSPGRG